jgi:hypothetical protein
MLSVFVFSIREIKSLSRKIRSVNICVICERKVALTDFTEKAQIKNLRESAGKSVLVNLCASFVFFGNSLCLNLLVSQRFHKEEENFHK